MKRTLLTLAALFCLISLACAQTDTTQRRVISLIGQNALAINPAPKEPAIDSTNVYVVVEQKPSFQGGDYNTFQKWVQQHLTYPETEYNNGIQGRVTVRFIVNWDGSVKDVQVLRGVTEALDSTAVKVVKASPRWTPGMQRGRKVAVQLDFAVVFRTDQSIPVRGEEAVSWGDEGVTGPSFEGGDLQAFSKWVNEHLQYPAIAQENGVQGRVTLRMMVDSEGYVKEVKVLRGVDSSLDREAVRVVKSSPIWIPAVKDGKTVTCGINVPVVFRLQ